MIIIKLKGGLGNQMFQYATIRAISLQHKKKAYLDIQLINNSQFETDTFTPRHFSLNVFKIKIRPIDKFRKYIFKVRQAVGKKNHFNVNLVYNNYNDNSDFISMKFPAYLEGYFQSENYFSNYREKILDDFSLKIPLGKNNETILRDISKQQSVSLHFRRGDYVNKPGVFLYHGICSLDYYKTAMDYFMKKIDSPVFYVFTDDPAWVQDNFIDLHPLYNISLVNINHGVDSWKDMWLMSKCKHNIIANSSFSWWGAWLNKNPDKQVIAPKQWYANPDMNSKTINMIPPDWLRL